MDVNLRLSVNKKKPFSEEFENVIKATIERRIYAVANMILKLDKTM